MTFSESHSSLRGMRAALHPFQGGLKGIAVFPRDPESSQILAMGGERSGTMAVEGLAEKMATLWGSLSCFQCSMEGWEGPMRFRFCQWHKVKQNKTCQSFGEWEGGNWEGKTVIRERRVCISDPRVYHVHGTLLSPKVNPSHPTPVREGCFRAYATRKFSFE